MAVLKDAAAGRRPQLLPYYTGMPTGFRAVVDSCPVPTLSAGRPRMNTVEDILQVVSSTLKAGASGGVFGRNIWQNKNPGGMVKDLQKRDPWA